jgi:hypothetical protein
MHARPLHHVCSCRVSRLSLPAPHLAELKTCVHRVRGDTDAARHHHPGHHLRCDGGAEAGVLEVRPRRQSAWLGEGSIVQHRLRSPISFLEDNARLLPFQAVVAVVVLLLLLAARRVRCGCTRGGSRRGRAGISRRRVGGGARCRRCGRGGARISGLLRSANGGSLARAGRCRAVALCLPPTFSLARRLRASLVCRLLRRA